MGLGVAIPPVMAQHLAWSVVRTLLGLAASDVLRLHFPDTRAPWWLGLHLRQGTSMCTFTGLCVCVHVWMERVSLCTCGEEGMALTAEILQLG